MTAENQFETHTLKTEGLDVTVSVNEMGGSAQIEIIDDLACPKGMVVKATILVDLEREFNVQELFAELTASAGCHGTPALMVVSSYLNVRNEAEIRKVG